jgi:hypothetical protein
LKTPKPRNDSRRNLRAMKERKLEHFLENFGEKKRFFFVFLVLKWNENVHDDNEYVGR